MQSEAPELPHASEIADCRLEANSNSQQHLGRTWCTSLVPKVPRLTTRPENSPRRSPPWVWMAATRSLDFRMGVGIGMWQWKHQLITLDWEGGPTCVELLC